MIGRATKNIVVEKGFFFIRVVANQGAVDFFAHRSALRGLRIQEVQENDLLQFTPTDTERGCRAEEIRRAPAGSVEGAEETDLAIFQ